jgi:hypothetical protein
MVSTLPRRSEFRGQESEIVFAARIFSYFKQPLLICDCVPAGFTEFPGGYACTIYAAEIEADLRVVFTLRPTAW